MFLSISTSRQPATDLGYLLHKHPARLQSFSLSFGQAHVFYPVATVDHCEACLLLDVDSVGIVRGRSRQQSESFSLGQYVSDRPYVASSFLCVAIAQVFGSAMAGRCKDKPEVTEEKLPLSVKIESLPLRGGEGFLNNIFQPLGYSVDIQRQLLDARFPDWGQSPYATVFLKNEITLSQLLKHLYVLIPVFDNYKHYYIGQDELEKLLAKGQSWLESHPEREAVVRRYLMNRPSLYRHALERLSESDLDTAEPEQNDASQVDSPGKLYLNQTRYDTVLNALQKLNINSVLDLGCGEGKFLRQLVKVRQFERIAAVDVSPMALQRASQRIDYDDLPAKQQDRIQLFQASVTYRDSRFTNYDAAVGIEVIEHLDPNRLAAFERVIFEFANPKFVIITTPNHEYNKMWPNLAHGRFRHSDHRFEWTRAQFQEWANKICDRFDYQVQFESIGPEDESVGPPTQMGIFSNAK